MKKLILLPVIMFCSLSYSQTMFRSYNYYQPHYNYYDDYPYAQTTNIVTYVQPQVQYQTPLGNVLESLIRVVAQNRIIKNDYDRIVNENRYSKRRNRKRRRRCR